MSITAGVIRTFENKVCVGFVLGTLKLKYERRFVLAILIRRHVVDRSWSSRLPGLCHTLFTQSIYDLTTRHFTWLHF